MRKVEKNQNVYSFSTVPHNAQPVKSRKTPSMQHKEERKSYVFRSLKDKQTRGESGHLPHLCRKFLYIYHVYTSFVPSFLAPQTQTSFKTHEASSVTSHHLKNDDYPDVAHLFSSLPAQKKKCIFTKQTKCPPSLQQNGTRQHLECSKRKQKLDLKTRQR